jgi:hypothetical protein
MLSDAEGKPRLVFVWCIQPVCNCGLDALSRIGPPKTPPESTGRRSVRERSQENNKLISSRSLVTYS